MADAARGAATLKRTAHESNQANEGVRQAMDVAVRAPEKPGTLREAVERRG